MSSPLLESEDELRIIKTYVLLPVVMDVLQKDMKTMNTLQLKMPQIYIKFMQKAQIRTTAEMYTLRRQMKELGIRIYEQRRTALSLDAQYLCRGYHHKLTLLWSVVKAEVQIKLSEYMDVNLIE